MAYTYHCRAADSAEDRLVHDEKELDECWQRSGNQQQNVGDGKRHQVTVGRRSHTAGSPHDQDHHQVAHQADNEDRTDEDEADNLVQRIVKLRQRRGVGRRRAAVV